MLAGAGGFWFANYFTHKPAYLDYAYYVLILTIFSVLIHKNQQGIYEYMHMNRDVSHLPKRQIRLINNLFLMGFLLLSGGTIFLFVHLPYQNVVNGIKTCLIAVIPWIARLLFRQKPVESKEVTLPDVGQAFFDLPRSEDTLLYAAILDKIFVFIGVICIIALGLFILFVLYKKLTTRKGGMELDTREFISPKMTREKTLRSVPGEKLHFFERSTEGRIRKLYFRTIRRHLSAKKSPQSSMTPSQIEELAALTPDDALTQLHEAYEKARYDTDRCTREDLDRAKKGTSGLLS